MNEWKKIDYNPEVFTELLKNIGVKGVLIEEILSYDSLENSNMSIYGLIFIGKYIKNNSYTPNILQYWDKDLFFIKQISQNSSSTQTLIELILNNEDKIDMGPILLELKSTMREMDPLTRAIAFSNNEKIKNEHNKFKIGTSNELNNNINNINNSILKGNSNTILNHYNNNNGFPFMKRNDLRFVNNNPIFKYNENYESYKNGNNNINLSFSINDKNIRKSLYNINQNNIENMNINFNNNKLNNPMNSNFKNNKNNNTFNNSNNNLKNKSTKNKKNKGSNKNYQLKKLEILEKIDEATLIKKIINSVNKTFYNYKILCSSNGNKLHCKFIFFNFIIILL